MIERYFKQNDWSGGLADSVLFGTKGSVAEAVGVDIRSEPKVLKVSQALVKESGATVTDFCKWAINVSDGNSYWFGGSGKIYKRTSAGVWSNVYTDSNGAILGAMEFDGYIYWATATKLGRQLVTLAASEASWTSQNNAWQTLTSAGYHPMTVQGLYLFIGNNRDIASVSDAGSFTANGTPDVTFASLPHIYGITCLINFGIDILIGTNVTTTYSSARIFRWDTVSPTYISADDIPEIGINCFIPTDNFVFIQAGTQGSLYFYNGSILERIKKVKGDYSNKTMIVYPGSSCVFRGVAMFGVSNLSGNPCLEGVYSFGQYDRNYPLSLTLEYVPSPNHLTAMEVGAMLAVGNNLVVAWKDSSSGTTYGVDNISWTTKYGSAYIKTLIIGGNREKQKIFEEFNISYKSKPTNTEIALSYYPNYNSSNTSITLKDQTSYNKMSNLNKFEAGVAQFRLDFTVSSNNAPEVEELYIKFSDKDVL